MTLTIYWKKKPFQVVTISSISMDRKSGFVSVIPEGSDTPAVFALSETFGISIAS